MFIYEIIGIGTVGVLSGYGAFNLIMKLKGTK